MNKVNYPFGRIEGLYENVVIAEYRVYGVKANQAIEKFGNFAIGQTIGTWIPVPGITEKMIEKYQARVLSFFQIQIEPEEVFLLKVAFPTANFASNFASLLTGIIGNDVSTSLEVRLENLEFMKDSVKSFGYRKSQAPIEKLRKITGVKSRPLMLNMIKPCLGFDAKTGAAFFQEVAKGGMDLVKDDELLANPDYCPVEERIDEYQKISNEVFQETGKKTLYLPNITDSPERMKEHARYAVDAGIKACLINYIFTGYDSFAEICREFDRDLFVMGHYAGINIYHGNRCGIADSVNLGILPRLAGADAIMTMYAKPKMHQRRMQYYANIQNQMSHVAGTYPFVSTIGGGITPVDVPDIISELGRDIIIGIGGAVQGHPMGTTAGSKAVMDVANVNGRDRTIETEIQRSPELAAAVEAWR